jgi:L,D-transpeptidase catalytic domain/Putative peptidoglycan binding domain
MSRTRAVWIYLAVVAVVAALMPSGAGAQEAPAITLEVSRTKMKFGKTVKFSGVASPVSEPQAVTLVDEAGAVIAETTTNSSGAFSVKVTPRRNMKVRAQWSDAVSDRVAVKVRPIVVVRLRDVRLFGRALVKGNVKPAMPGERITVKLKRYGHTIATKRVVLRKGRWFETRMKVSKPGTLRARGFTTSAEHLRGAAGSPRRDTNLPSLAPGSSSPHVRLLEKRLIDLGYYLPRADRTFDVKTADALRAFNKVHHRARVGTVDAATWRKMASPIIPKARFKSPKFHIEIDQTRQVLFTVRNGKVKNILHTSTGAGGATRDGSWTVHRKLAGTSGGGLYYPSYFDGLRAIHRWPEVPTYPASHGCSRVPMWSATWIFSQVPMGTRVYVYH